MLIFYFLCEIIIANEKNLKLFKDIIKSVYAMHVAQIDTMIIQILWDYSSSFIIMLAILHNLFIVSKIN